MEYFTTYYRDGKKISFEEFKMVFKEDLDKENESYAWDIRGAIYSDWNNGHDVALNGHEYKCRTDCLYNSARELLDDLMCYGDYEVIFDALKAMPDVEIFDIVSKMECVNIIGRRCILKDKKDWK